MQIYGNGYSSDNIVEGNKGMGGGVSVIASSEVVTVRSDDQIHVSMKALWRNG